MTSICLTDTRVRQGAVSKNLSIERQRQIPFGASSLSLLAGWQRTEIGSPWIRACTRNYARSAGRRGPGSNVASSASGSRPRNLSRLCMIGVTVFRCITIESRTTRPPIAHSHVRGEPSGCKPRLEQDLKPRNQQGNGSIDRFHDDEHSGSACSNSRSFRRRVPIPRP